MESCESSNILADTLRYHRRTNVFATFAKEKHCKKLRKANKVKFLPYLLNYIEKG